MDEIPVPPAAGSPGEAAPAPLSWPVADTGAKRVRKIPRRTLTISIATTALVLVGGAVLAGAVAAAPNGNGTPTPGTPDQKMPGQAMPGRPGGPMMQGKGQRMAGPGQAVHGEYTVPNGSGGYSTEEMQRGSITAVNGSTFTVKSDDGYTHDWVTDANTGYGMRRGGNNDALTMGENVMVMGTKDGDTFHAVRVMTMRQPGQGQAGQQAAPGQDGRMGKMPYRGGKFGPRFGGMQNGQMPNGQMPNGQMPNGQMPSPPMQSAPSPDQTQSAPESSPTPTQAS